MGKTLPLFHKLKSVVGYSIAIIVIVAALAVSGLRLLLTTANLYHDEVEQLATSLLEQPVKIGRMDARLAGLVPTIIFHNVELLSEETKKSLFSLSRIDVGLSVDDLIWNQKILPAQITVRGVNLHVTRTVDGSFKVKGVDLKAISKSEKTESKSLLERLLSQQSEIGFEDSTFAWKDEQNAGLTWFFEDVNLLLKNSIERHQISLSGRLPDQLGDKINLSIDLVGDISSPETWDIKTFIESKKFNLSPVRKYIKNSKIELTGGAADLKLWLDWKNESLNKLSGDLKLYDFSYHTNKKKNVALNFVSGVFDVYQDENKLWNVSVDKFNYGSKKAVEESTFSLAFKYKEKMIDTFYFNANYVSLEEFSDVVTDNHIFDDKYERYIKNLAPYGEMRNVYMAWRNNRLYKFNADVRHLRINDWGKIPKITSISGEVDYEKNKGVVSLSSENTIIGFPGMFRNDFRLQNLNAKILFSNTDDGVFINTTNLKTKNSDVSAVTSARIFLPKNSSSPYLDLQTFVLDGDISKTSNYLPVSIMNKSLVKWLDDGLQAGKVKKGTVLFNGKINDFPFNNQEGEFSVAVETANTTLNYLRGWPKITEANTHAYFTGQGMKIQLLSGKSGGNVLHHSLAKIMSFTDAELNLELDASGTVSNAMKYIISTPILPEAKETVDFMTLSGNVDANINIHIPLNDKSRIKKPLSYSGVAKLNNASLFMLDDKVDITNVSGEISFSDKQVTSKDLIAKVFGENATMTLSSSTKNKYIQLASKGTMQPGEILKRFAIPGAEKISGATHFSSDMIFPVKGNKNKSPTLIVDSDLFGVSSSLPDKFYKQRNIREKFNFITTFSGDNKFHIGATFKNKSSAILELVKSKNDIFLNKGAVSISDKKAILPRKNILYVDGDIDKFSASKWNDVFESDKSTKKTSFFKRPIVVNLSKFKIVTNDENSKDEKSAISRPINVPLFEGIINKLYLDDVFLGRLDFKATRKNYGFHFDEIILSKKNLKLFSNGDWHYKNGKHKTSLNLTISSDNFGRMLTGLGFAAVIEKGIAKTVGKLSWGGAPSQFSLKGLNGNIQLKIKDGNIVEAEAGAGRLLGLFSLSALPRKLFGDFSDTFKSGFNFDSANGAIRINAGDAYTEGFLIKSPVAEVSVSGRTGLAKKDYDNIIEVVPEIGGGIAGVTALLVNLPAGIGLWLIDKLTGEKINKVSTRIYEVTGSWDKPVIEEVKTK